MLSKNSRSAPSPTIKIVILIFLVAIVGFMLIKMDSKLYKSDVEIGYDSLGLSEEFILINKDFMSTKGDLITSALEAELRIYKVSMNMMDTKNYISEIIQREEDKGAYSSNFDRRLSMHTEYLGKNNFVDHCSPAQIPINAGSTFLTIILSNSLEEAEVEFDGDGHACGLNPPFGHCSVSRNYSRNTCTLDNSETYITFVVWNMD